METNYYLTEGDAGKIAIITEKLYQKRFEIGDTVIGWEEFTTRFMKFSIPEIDDELGMRKWVDARTTWPKWINDELLRHKYPMQLFVSPNAGIFVRVLKGAISELARRRIKKNINVLIKSLEDIEAYRASRGFPNSIKLMDALITITNSVIRELSLGLEKTPGIAAPIRKELKMIVNKKMPKRKNNLELPLGETA